MARNDAELEAIFGKLPFVNYTVLDGLINPTFIAEPWPNFANIVVSWGLDAILAGILATQFFSYVTSKSYSNDPMPLKVTVWFLIILNTAQSGFLWFWNLDATIVNIGHYWPYLECKRYVAAYVILALQIITLHLFFAWRLWRLYDKRWYVPAGVLLMTAGGVGGLIGGSVTLSRVYTVLEATLQEPNMAKVWGTVYVALFLGADTAITVLLLFALIRAGSGSGAHKFKSTDSLLKRLILLVIETQAPPALLSLAAALEFSIKADLKVSVPYNFVCGQLYGIGLLYSLSSRKRIHREVSSHVAERTNARNGEGPTIRLRRPGEPRLDEAMALQTFGSSRMPEVDMEWIKQDNATTAFANHIQMHNVDLSEDLERKGQI